MRKIQFTSDEPLRIVFPPFVNSTDGSIITNDNVTLVSKNSGGVVNPALVPARDPDTFFWTVSVPANEFVAGEWLIMATSDNVNTTPQFLALTWGDYVDDIVETNKSALNRWKIESNVLTLYDDDGTTILRQYNLLDEFGQPTSTRVFEKDPV